MSFQPLIGAGGYAGWRLLSRTMDLQRSTISREPAFARDITYMRQKVATLASPDDLLGDFRLLKTALSAFGLEADQGKTAFLRKVLESDPSDKGSFASRLSDKRYRAFAEAFGFAAKSRPGGLADQIATRHVAAELERRVGTADGNLRLALNAQRELAQIGASDASDNARWYSILGSLPVRKVVEGALGLGSDFGKLPIDRQLSEVRERSSRVLGSDSPSIFADPAMVEKTVQQFLLRASGVTSVQSSYQVALTLLSD